MILFYNIRMNIINFLKKELTGFSNKEKIIFFSIILAIASVSIYLKDEPAALIGTICGITYTILAGKGKVFCYFFGITATVCYCYLTYINGFWGNLILHGFYYLPLEIIGIYKWLQNYKKDTNEIIKTHLSTKERFVYFSSTILISFIVVFLLKITGGNTPYMDGITTSFSILGQILTVKRCIEQWWAWIIVDVLAFFMWLSAFSSGSNCFATVIMKFGYCFLAFYFLFIWHKELYSKKM